MEIVSQIWNNIKSVYAWLIETVQQYPQIALWAFVISIILAIKFL